MGKHVDQAVQRQLEEAYRNLRRGPARSTEYIIDDRGQTHGVPRDPGQARRLVRDLHDGKRHGR